MAEAPAWLNQKFVEKIITNCDEYSGVKVTNISVKPATAKGDNYTSDMLRVTIDYTDSKTGSGKCTVIIKLSPQQEGVQKNLVTSAGLFNTEISMMTNTLKKMNSLVGPSSRFSGTGYYTQSEDPVLLVLEDLSPLGYRMACRHSGLDMEHTLLAIRGLAKFHAASVAVCEKEPDQKNLYTKGMFNKLHPKELGQYFNNTVHCLADEIAKWPEAKQYAAKLSALSSHCYNVAADASVRKDNEFNVITHGDYWVNNMLFRYENEKPIGHIMVDFQLCNYTSPAMDLLYFLNTSISDDIYFNHKDEVLKEYQQTLSATMASLGCKASPPSIGDLQKAMKERAVIGMIASFTILPIILVEKSEVRNIDEMLSEDGKVDNPGLKGEAFRKTMIKRLPQYAAAGLFDL